MKQHGFLGLGLSVVLSSAALAACSSSDSTNPGAKADAGPSSGGASGSGSGGAASGGKSSTGGSPGAGGKSSTAGTTSTGGATDASPPGTGGTDAGTQADAATPAACGSDVDAGSQCNTLVNTAGDVTLTAASGTMPTGTGGTLEDGLYHSTKLAYYPGSSLAGNVLTTRQTLLVCGNTVQHVENPTGKPEKRSSDTVSFAGIVPTVTQTCNTAAGSGIIWTSYTATSTAFTLYSASLGFEAVFTKQ